MIKTEKKLKLKNMPVFSNLLARIVEWFQDKDSRNKLIISFNRSAKESYIQGDAPTILEASITKGCREFKHQYSWFNSGFRIKAHTGRQLTREEMIQIGQVIMNNPVLVRRLVVLGWDTLEVCCDIGNQGLKWQLKDFLLLN